MRELIQKLEEQRDVWVDEHGAKIRMDKRDFRKFVVDGLGLRPNSSQPEAKNRSKALRQGRILRGEEPVPRGWLDHIRKTYKNVKITNDPKAKRRTSSDKGSMNERRVQSMYDKAMKKIQRKAKGLGRDWAADAWGDELTKNPNRSADEVERYLLDFAQSAAADIAMSSAEYEFPELWKLLPETRFSAYGFARSVPTRSDFREGAADAYGEGLMSGVRYQKKKFAKKFKGM